MHIFGSIIQRLEAETLNLLISVRVRVDPPSFGPLIQRLEALTFNQLISVRVGGGPPSSAGIEFEVKRTVCGKASKYRRKVLVKIPGVPRF